MDGLTITCKFVNNGSKIYREVQGMMEAYMKGETSVCFTTCVLSVISHMLTFLE